MELPSITKSIPSRVEVRKVNSTLKFSPNVMLSKKNAKKSPWVTLYYNGVFSLFPGIAALTFGIVLLYRYYNYSHTVSCTEGCSVS